VQQMSEQRGDVSREEFARRALPKTVLFDGFRRRGVRRLFVKHLAPNDNDKNQIYIAPSLDGMANLLRGRLSEGSESTSSTRVGSSPGRPKMVLHLDWVWITADDRDATAPNTKLIYYFQYPEVRLSGFLSGCTDPPDSLRRTQLGRYDRRILLFGTNGECVFGHVIAGPPGSGIPDIPGLSPSPVSTVLLETHLGDNTFREEFVRRDLKTVLPPVGGETNQERLPVPGDETPVDYNADEAPIVFPKPQLVGGETVEERLRELIGPWHPCVVLRDDGVGPVPFTGPQRAGFTLEALLGIAVNATPGPDIEGWELKTFRFSTMVTLMTPVADGGRERTLGMRRFLERHGREGRDGESLRFTGRYRVGSTVQGRTLELEGTGSHILEKTGVALVESDPPVVLSRWSSDRLSAHWLAKHDSVFYVDYENHPTRNMVRFHGYYRCSGTSPERFLDSIATGVVCFDPAHTLKHGQLKTRPQWRISTARRTMTDSLNDLYGSVERFEGV